MDKLEFVREVWCDYLGWWVVRTVYEDGIIMKSGRAWLWITGGGAHVVVQRVMLLLHEHEEWSLDLEHPHKILTSVVSRGKGSLKPDGKLEQLGSANAGFIHNT